MLFPTPSFCVVYLYLTSKYNICCWIIVEVEEKKWKEQNPDHKLIYSDFMKVTDIIDKK